MCRGKSEERQISALNNVFISCYMAIEYTLIGIYIGSVPIQLDMSFSYVLVRV